MIQILSSDKNDMRNVDLDSDPGGCVCACVHEWCQVPGPYGNFISGGRGEGVMDYSPD